MVHDSSAVGQEAELAADGGAGRWPCQELPGFYAVDIDEAASHPMQEEVREQKPAGVDNVAPRLVHAPRRGKAFNTWLGSGKIPSKRDQISLKYNLCYF